MPTRRQRLSRLECARGNALEEVEPEPRVAGKTRMQAMLDYIDYYKRLLNRDPTPENRAELEASIQRIEQILPREREIEQASPGRRD